jgi:heterodisulfide reductase subunit C
MKFGYTIHKDNQIDFDKNSRLMFEYISSLEPSIKTCIGCGSCTATCSTGNFTEFSLRKLYLLIKRGEISGIKNEIGKCMLCGKCMLVCPRGVNTRNVILSIQRALLNESFAK